MREDEAVKQGDPLVTELPDSFDDSISRMTSSTVQAIDEVSKQPTVAPLTSWLVQKFLALCRRR